VNSKHSQETFLLQQHHTYQKSSYFKTAPSKKKEKISSFHQQFNNICINKTSATSSAPSTSSPGHSY
jgi:hypothetical protein